MLLMPYCLLRCDTTTLYMCVSSLFLPLPPAPPFAHTHADLSLPTANIIHGYYQYTSNLVKLSTTSSPSPYCTWPLYHSPIKLDELAPFLNSHPDQALASYIHVGLPTGFRIGYSLNCANLRSHNLNHPSTLGNNKQVVD